MSEFVQTVKNGHSPFEGKNILLGRLDMELTERCNNNCIHCCINLPAGDTDAHHAELPTAEVQEILGEAAELGCMSVRFTGGEPLLRPDFEELYLFTRRLGLKVLLFTNARLLTPHLADLFAQIPPLERIEITVYGMRAESYESVSRAAGSFTQHRRGIQLLLEREIPFVVKCALLPPNRAEMDEFEEWAASLPWMDHKPGYSMFFDLRNRRDSMAKNRLIKSLRLSPEEGLAVLTRDEVGYRKEMTEFCTKFMRPSRDKLFSCGAGCGGCIDAYGRFQPCIGVSSPELTYDLRQGSLHDALTNFFPKIRKIKATNQDYLQRCAVCFLKGLCEQCPAKSWAESGTLDTPVEYLCQVAHAEARYLGLVREDENAWEVVNWQERIERLLESQEQSAMC